MKKLGENESVLITDFAGSLVKNIDLSNIDGNSTFSNKAITRKDIKVVKTWEDGSDKHLKDHATVYLKRYPEGQSPESAQIYKAVTLNSSEYKGIELPGGVAGEFTEKWNYTWSSIPISENGITWKYFIEEQSNNQLYSPEISSTLDITEGSGTIEVPVYIPQNAWIQANSIENYTDYILVAEKNNKSIKLT